jgi:hypothetical protein
MQDEGKIRTKISHEFLRTRFVDTSAKAASTNETIAGQDLSKMISQKAAEISDIFFTPSHGCKNTSELMKQSQNALAHAQRVEIEFTIHFTRAVWSRMDREW